MLKLIFRSSKRNSNHSLHSCVSGSYIAQPCTVRTLVASRPRRHSSSKPSSSSNGDSTSIPASANPSSKEVAAGSRKRTSGKGTRPRSKEGVRKSGVSSSLSILGVPSTQHLHSQDITLASFFSLHRPISVVAPVPPTSTDEAFSAIFTSTPKPRTEEAPFTIASAVSSSPLRASDQHTSDDLRPGATRVSNLNAESHVNEPHPLYINVEELTQNFRPFDPPPPPEPVSIMNNHSAYRILDLQNATAQAAVADRINHTALISHQVAPMPFHKRMRIRQNLWKVKRIPLQQSLYQAISVRRQRKLKMKKHKYKKLMKRTRNLRRKLDRL